MFKGLREIKGVGEKVYDDLIKHFGSEEEALRALGNQEYHELLSAGLSFQKAILIAREVYSKRNSFEYIELMRTPEAKEIFNSISSLLRGHAFTDYGRLRLGLFYPTKDGKEIKRRRQLVQEAMKVVSTVLEKRLEEIKACLKELKPLTRNVRKSRVTGSVLVTEDKELYEELRSRYSDLVEVFFLESGGDIEFLQDYALVRYLSAPGSVLLHVVESLPRAVILQSTVEEEMLPEAVLPFFIENRGSIKACYQVMRLLEGEEGKVSELEEAVKTLDALCNSKESCGRFAYAFKNLRGVAEGCAEEANKELVKRIEEGGYSLAGRDVLKILSTMKHGDIYGALPTEIISAIADVSREWESECARRLGIEDEALAFSGLFSREELYPVEIDREALARLEGLLEEEAVKSEFRENQRAAGFLKSKEELIRRSIARVLELDFLLALGRFALKYEAHPAEINHRLGTSFKGGKNLLLRDKEGEGGPLVQPVGYVLGESAMEFRGAKGERVAVLTGANSGGKTTLIETIAQVQLMAQSGLPVLAEKALVPILDEVHYYGRRRGDTSAGAFEALLRSMAGILGRRGRRLILADEIEAITEPGAAAKILAALLEAFLMDRNCLACVVTHLGEDLRELGQDVRLDGIEASGLDKNLNLIVDRNPVLNKIARSTPELIVEKLSKSDEDQADFYKAILKKFK